MNIALRKFDLNDARTVASLAGDKALSQWTTNIPHPYSEQDAYDWITRINQNEKRHAFAITLDNALVGCISYWNLAQGGIEVGYWVGKQYWGLGIATKAMQHLLAGDDFPKSEPVFAKVMADNIGSQRVLEKAGFSFYKTGVVAKCGQTISAKFYVLERSK